MGGSTSTTPRNFDAGRRGLADHASGVHDGIGDGGMRISVGIEDREDLWADLDAALPR